MQLGAEEPSAEARLRVRRLATLRAAQRALHGVAEPGEFREALELGRKLLRRLQALSGDHARAEILDRDQAIQGVDGLLRRLSDRICEVLVRAEVSALASSLGALASEESGAIRALAAVALDAELEGHVLDVIEFLVALLSCDTASEAATLARAPLEALPELSNVIEPAAYEAHPAIQQAGQIFGRGAARLDQDDPGATRDRILGYKRRLGVRRLHPEVMAAAVAYDVAMANRLAELREGHDFQDALAETVFGADAAGPAAAKPARPTRVVAQPTARQARRSRLFWHALATVGLSVGLVVLAALLWQRPSVRVLAVDSATAISPHLVAGYLSGDDGMPHFVGTLGDSWGPLPLPERRLVVARISARLESDGVQNVTLVNAHHAIQARQEGDTLLWVTAPGSR
jgi:hypothetical protein